MEGTYFNGQMNGTWIHYYDNGEKQRKEFYVYKDCGLFDYIWYECPHGTWTYWDKDGRVMKIEKYIDGELTEN